VREIKVFTDNISLKYFEFKTQAIPKELRLYDVIAFMNVNLIHKPGRENLVLDTLSRREDLMTILTMTLTQDNYEFEKQVKEAYKNDEKAIELNKMFDYKRVPKKGLSSKFSKLKVVKRVKGLFYYKQTRIYLPKGQLRKTIMREFHDTRVARH